MESYKKDVAVFTNAVKGKEFFVFDVETTGLSPAEDHIIEFSAIKVQENGGTFKETDALDIFINPGIPIPEEASKINGITDADVADAPTEKEAAQKILAFLGERPLLAGYNSVSFDANFANALYAKAGLGTFQSAVHLDILKMAREKTPRPHKLIDLATRAGVAGKYRFHRSIEDVRATLDVLQYLLPMYEDVGGTVPGTEETLTVRRIERFTMAGVDRVYVNNTKNLSLYYDVKLNRWMAAKGIDIDNAVKAAYRFAGVSDDVGLLSAVQNGAIKEPVLNA